MLDAGCWMLENATCSVVSVNYTSRDRETDPRKAMYVETLTEE